MNRLVAWFAENSVASNLLMFLLLFGGIASLAFGLVRKESFPEVPPETISVSVLYPGATPEEIEESICVKLEESVEGLDDIDRLVSKASEGVGTVTIEIVDGADLRTVLDDVKAEVDAIDTFPEDAEQPIIKEAKIEEPVIAIAIRGRTDSRTLRVLTDELRDDLVALPPISKAEVEGSPPYEFSIEVEEEVLRRYGITFDAVTAAVRRSSINLPAGSVKTEGGEILFRSQTQAYTAGEFERIPVITAPDGAVITLGELGRVVHGFEETDQDSRLDGIPALIVQIYRVGRQNTTDIADAVHDFVLDAQEKLPEGIDVVVWDDRSTYLRERLELLGRNGLQGLLLVFLVLALFLKARLAFWVGIGLSAAILGAVWVLPMIDVSINFLSTFGFILVLGILVDDAIVVGENIEAHRDMGKSPSRSAIDGAREVMVPVSLAVITTGIAFSPMLRLPGQMGTFSATIAIVVIVAIAFSLIESLFILPSHLGHESHPHRQGGIKRFLADAFGETFAPLGKGWSRFQGLFTGFLSWLIERVYRPFLDRVIAQRYLVLACGFAFLLVTFGLIEGGWVKQSFFPPIEGNDVIAAVTLPEGVSVERALEVQELIERTGLEIQRDVEEEAGQQIVTHVRTSIGEQPGTRRSGPPQVVGPGESRVNLLEVHMQLISAEKRDVLASTIATEWRDRVGNAVPDAISMTFTSDQINAGAPINVELQGKELDSLIAAASALKEKVATYEGTFNIADDYRKGKRELELEVTPSGLALGLTQQDVARQVRQAFFGDEAQRVQVGKHNLKVYVRYPVDERLSLANLETMRIRLTDGSEVPFREVARASITRGPASINRIDRRRTIVVTADLNRSIANADDVVRDLKQAFLPGLVQKYPGVTYDFGGEQRRQSENWAGLQVGMFLSFFLMFGLLAVVFRSYLQPLIVLSAIPFGVAGAIWGHFFLGMNITFLSTVGILALSGVVVNDSLVMIDFVNRFRRNDGKSLLTAIREAGPRRFRPILLTSLTTCAGLTPILLEKSVQAAFVIPMAVSLAFGVGCTTIIVLVLVPAGYLVLEDIRGFLLGARDEEDDIDPRITVETPEEGAAPA